jgi:hypothetical protein
MADQGIKKVVIKKSDLPPVGPDNDYTLRYRLISEDRNRISHWSQTYNILGLPVEEVDGDVAISGNIINAVWGDEEGRPAYDVFVKYNTDLNFVYHGTSKVHNYQFLKETGTSLTNVRVAIQIEGINKDYNSSLVIYDSGVVSLV